MLHSTVHLHTAMQIGEVDPRIFSGFLEHMGRAVYGGVYDPESGLADEDGFRRDVLDALKPLAMPLVRYPGGNFVSGYDWRDGVGPREERPVRIDRAWNAKDPNTFGTDEFMRLCRKMDWQPMMAVNLGEGTPEQARDWLEYVCGPAGTAGGAERKRNGRAEPYHAPVWCLGNEMDGPWQIGHVDAEQYGKKARRAAELMREVCQVELVVSGSSTNVMPTFGEWDRVALEAVGELASYISLHRYAGNWTKDTPDYLAISNSIDRQIEAIDAVCQSVHARLQTPTRPYLCFDEWNVWDKTFVHGKIDAQGEFAHPLCEEIYTLEDALVVAGFLHSFVRHADVVKIANLAQIVNVLGPLITRGDDLLVQSIYHPFLMFSRRRQGRSLRVAVEGPGYQGEVNGPATFVDASAILDGHRLSVFVTNRSLTDPLTVTLAVADRPVSEVIDAELVTGPEAQATNSFEQPDQIAARPFSDVEVADQKAQLVLPPLSFAASTLALGNTGGTGGPLTLDTL